MFISWQKKIALWAKYRWIRIPWISACYLTELMILSYFSRENSDCLCLFFKSSNCFPIEKFICELARDVRILQINCTEGSVEVSEMQSIYIFNKIKFKLKIVIITRGNIFQTFVRAVSNTMISLWHNGK